MHKENGKLELIQRETILVFPYLKKIRRGDSYEDSYF